MTRSRFAAVVRTDRRTEQVVVAAAGAAALGVVAAATAFDPTWGLGAAALVLTLGLVACSPSATIAFVMPALTLVPRVGAAGVDLSISDFALAAAFGIALVLGRRPFSRPVRSILWLTAVYQAATLFTVVANPYAANTVEWFHAWLLVGGAVVVGWAAARDGHGRLATNLLVAPMVVVAVAAIVKGAPGMLAGAPSPVYLDAPFSLHKNALGDILAFGATIAYARPRWLGWNRPVAIGLFLLFAAGIAAAQSRQAMVGLAVAVLVLILRPEPGRHRSRLPLLGIPVAVWYVWQTVAEQLASGNTFNSTYQRLTWFEQSLAVWNSNEWFGVGLRWWTAGRTEFEFQPPNAELEVLSSAGTVGLLGFLVMMIGVLVVAWRVDPRYGTLAVAVVANRMVQGQLDLFWVAVQTSLPFVIVGLCLGAQAHDAERLRPALPAAVLAGAGPGSGTTDGRGPR
ncbi:O-antigen ligase family protein [Isoptericola sp. F-RaC21]|uniref:O-antigen ligase family protein n=1 Tax=Isoptericola sp. F-RaC21 TaxID=3141452 RepID=UPI00315BDED7